MKLYGWDDTGPYRGDLLAADVDACDLKFFSLESFAAELEWEKVFTNFRDARQGLLIEMTAVDADPDLMLAVKTMKASFVPVTQTLKVVAEQ